MIIRQAESTDALAIATIHVRSWQHAYRDLLPADQLAALSIKDREKQWLRDLDPQVPAVTIVAEVNNAVMGFACWGLAPESCPVTALLYSIHLLPEARGKGIGSALMREAEQGMIAAGARIGSLHVLVENTPTRAFYEHLGWQCVPGEVHQEHFFGMDMRTITYRKVLT